MYGKAGEDRQGLQKDKAEKALTALYPGLLRYCRFLSQNNWDGDDLAQAAMMKAIHRYRDEESINAALLKRIAYHQWIDIIRKRKKEILAEPAERAEKDQTMLLETAEMLMECFTPQQMVIFTLKEAFQYTLGEIAELMGTTETAVKATLHRAKQRISSDSAMSLAVYWNDENWQLLSNAVYDSLRIGDPEKLITAIPYILKEKANKQPLQKRTSPPVSTLRMAA